MDSPQVLQGSRSVIWVEWLVVLLERPLSGELGLGVD
jgi:hypothetical protein